MRFYGLSVTSLIVALVSIVVLGGTGAWLTKLDAWYYGLKKPWWQPPDYLFGPAWTTIFVLTGCSGVIAWNSPRATAEQRLMVPVAFALNFALNMLWSALFFMKRRPDLAFAEVVFFWGSIVAMIVVVRPVSTTAAWLLAPYLLWVSFASVLNLRVATLNGPFTKS